MDVTFRELESYYSSDVTSFSDYLPDIKSSRHDGDDSGGEVLVKMETIRYPYSTNDSTEHELEDEKSDEMNESDEVNEIWGEHELIVYQRRRKENESINESFETIPIQIEESPSSMSRLALTFKTFTSPLMDIIDPSDVISYPTHNIELRRTSRSNARNPPKRYDFTHDIAQFVSYS